MKVAVVHDRLIDFGGAVRVALTLSKVFGADVYTGKYDPNKTYPEFRNLVVRELNPISDFSISQMYPLVRMLDAVKFSSLRELRNYDLVFTSGQWAHFASRRNSNNIWYSHSPNRALYDLRRKISKRYNVLWRTIFHGWADFWTYFDQKSMKEYVNKIVVNSQNVKQRVRKFYNRDAIVVYPPVRVNKFYRRSSEGYYLSVQRLMPEKRVDLQLKIFEQLPNERLIIVGKAEYGTEYQQKISRWISKLPNVEWQEHVNDEELRELYARCKAVIQTSMSEDFGYVPVEAMASGKPCLAVNEGGFRESIIHSKTGLLVNTPYVENFIKAIKNFDKYTFDSRLCRKRAKDFSEEKFIKKMKKILSSLLGSAKPHV